MELENNRKCGPVAVTKSKHMFYGATDLFDDIGNKLGIATDLKQCFPEIYVLILSVIYYLILEDRNPLSLFPNWALYHDHLFGDSITSQRSSELFGLISENAKQQFFKLQLSRRPEEEYLTYDTTSISSYSKF